MQIYMATQMVCAGDISIGVAAPGQGKTVVLLLAAAYMV